MSTNTPRSSDPGALRVMVRVRPPRQDPEGTSSPALSGSKRSITAGAISQTTFKYDHVFWPEALDGRGGVGTQQAVFEEAAAPLLEAAVTGYNVCLFAYGQTGSGKTYSMMGCDRKHSGNGAGLIPRFCSQLLAVTSQRRFEFQIDMSYFEIYNEKIYDLLSPKDPSERKPLKVREHPVTGPYVENLTSHKIQNYENVQMLLNLGNTRRTTSATVHNDRSSRSHSIVQLTISQSVRDTVINSKVNLVDLAGSERIAIPSVNEVHYKEGLSINKSLLTLGKVINCLSDVKKRIFAPYRESVLTWLLKESLGGNSYTTMLATVCPDASTLDETLATLRYACQARRIVNKVSINEDPQHKVIRELRKEVNRLKSLKESNTKDNDLEILEMQQSAVEERLQIELQRLSKDLEVAEKRRSELELQKNLFIERIKTDDVSSYDSDFFNSLQKILNDSHEDNMDDSCNNSEVIEHIQDIKQSLDALHDFCAVKYVKVFDVRILPILKNMNKVCNELYGVFSTHNK